MKNAVHILLAEDDPDDRYLMLRAIERSNVSTNVRMVEDGEELMHYLSQAGPSLPAGITPRPHLILLDLRMPRKTGLEALREIKADPLLRGIPVVVLTGSEDQEELLYCYDLGANAVIRKTDFFDNPTAALHALRDFWMRTATLPGDGASSEVEVAQHR